ncbi:hypothetical protein C6Q14_02420, partial [Burkholderia ambifaria]
MPFSASRTACGRAPPGRPDAHSSSWAAVIGFARRPPPSPAGRAGRARRAVRGAARRMRGGCRPAPRQLT